MQQRNKQSQAKIPCRKTTAYHVLDEASEERLAGEVLVVGLEELSAGLVQLESGELEALLLEAAEDLSDEAALHAVRLDHDVCAPKSRTEKKTLAKK